MISNSSPRSDATASARRPLVSRVELEAQTRDALREMYDLLEQYAPAWYPRELHDKVGSIFRQLAK
jgi:hypothetical protein